MRQHLPDGPTDRTQSNSISSLSNLVILSFPSIFMIFGKQQLLHCERTVSRSAFLYETGKTAIYLNDYVMFIVLCRNLVISIRILKGSYRWRFLFHWWNSNHSLYVMIDILKVQQYLVAINVKCFNQRLNKKKSTNLYRC